MELYPSILVDIYQEFEKRVNLVKDLALLLHIDMGDGIFVPHKSFWDIEKIRNFPFATAFELHLMLEFSKQAITPWLLVPAKRIVVHYEAAHGDIYTLTEVIKEIKGAAKEVGVAINPGTSVEALDALLGELASVIVMGVEPGFSGQAFKPEVLEKVRTLRAKGFRGIIEVDGGMNGKTLLLAKEAGATAAAIASAIFSKEDPVRELTMLRHSVE